MILEVNSSYFPARRYNLDDVPEVFLCLSSEGYVSLSTEDDGSGLAYLYIEKGYLHLCPLASEHTITHNNHPIDGDVRVLNSDVFQIKDSLLRSEKDSILRFEFAESKIILMLGLVQVSAKQKHVVKVVKKTSTTSKKKILFTYAALMALVAVLGIILIVMKKTSSKNKDTALSIPQSVSQTSPESGTINTHEASETSKQPLVKAETTNVENDSPVVENDSAVNLPDASDTTREKKATGNNNTVEEAEKSEVVKEVEKNKIPEVVKTDKNAPISPMQVAVDTGNLENKPVTPQETSVEKIPSVSPAQQTVVVTSSQQTTIIESIPPETITAKNDQMQETLVAAKKEPEIKPIPIIHKEAEKADNPQKPAEPSAETLALNQAKQQMEKTKKEFEVMLRKAKTEGLLSDKLRLMFLDAKPNDDEIDKWTEADYKQANKDYEKLKEDIQLGMDVNECIKSQQALSEKLKTLSFIDKLEHQKKRLLESAQKKERPVGTALQNLDKSILEFFEEINRKWTKASELEKSLSDHLKKGRKEYETMILEDTEQLLTKWKELDTEVRSFRADMNILLAFDQFIPIGIEIREQAEQLTALYNGLGRGEVVTKQQVEVAFRKLNEQCEKAKSIKNLPQDIISQVNNRQVLEKKSYEDAQVVFNEPQ